VNGFVDSFLVNEMERARTRAVHVAAMTLDDERRKNEKRPEGKARPASLFTYHPLTLAETDTPCLLENTPRRWYPERPARTLADRDNTVGN